MSTPYKSIPSDLFFSKNDPQDLRLGDLVKSSTRQDPSLKKNSFVISGYCDDEGIQLNGGRIGAAEAPLRIRQFLYKMTPPVLDLQSVTMCDLGNLELASSLAERHQQAEQLSYEHNQKGLRPLTFGGGHDYGFPDASGFVKAHLNSTKKPIVLNFDAHLDVRPPTNGLNSGTPFFRLLSAYENQFEFFEIGIQPQCNSVHHRQWARSKGACIFDSQFVQEHGLLGLLQTNEFQKLEDKAPLFISFDIDALTSAEAPGCSQAWPTGFHLKDYLSLFAELKKRFDIRGLGIYEVSPPLDIDNYTSKAAALIAYHFLMQDVL
ncbi:formimidoylglutamase [Pseudobdellovibrio exovorus]|uniref:Formimidoylglutamase n=1 Tax=Pseudobdellovibrio exovorus JSS TaxID=1184267 RepID=M4VB89_9BACT|nr:formimidoylglutamase [Pseudobdellovibrio exovorus]AGH95291.1 formimidoylglutamase [Pseudobdellovibrio exovorus JSS]